MELTDRHKGIALASFGMLAVSSDSFFIRLADIDGFDLTFWVGVFTTITMTGVLVLAQRVDVVAETRRGGWPLWLAAMLQAGSTSLFVLAVTLTTVSNVVVIIAAAPVFAAGLSSLVLRERTSRRVWTAIGVVVVGVLIVVSGSFGGGSLTGDILAIGAIFLFGCSLVLLRSHSDMNRTLMVGLAGIGMALIAVIPATLFGHEGQTWLALVLMGFLFGPVSRVMLAVAPRFLPASEVGLFTPVETVAASLWAWLFFDEAPPAATVGGGFIIVSAVIWGMWTPRDDRLRWEQP